MTSIPLEFLSLQQLSTRLGDGSLSSESLVRHCLARIEALDPKLHAWVRTYAPEATAAAQAADLSRASGHMLGPLHGIPVGIKDIIDIEGRITTGGSPEWHERVSTVTAPLVRNLIRAGMIVLGKTHSVEFAMGGWGTNTGMGTPWNPWDLNIHRAPGGSSSGSGVAVASGMVPCAIGTDTGGSVRLPSVWNGLTGLKTTIGQVSCEGVLPLAPTFDTPGPMCRDAQDAALLFEVLRGNSSVDWTDDIPVLNALGQGIAGMTFGLIDAADRALSSTAMVQAFDSAVNQLEQLGARVVELNLSRRVTELGALVGQIIGMEGYSWVGHLTDDPNSLVDPDVRPRIALGRNRTATEYLLALREREAIKAAFAAETAHVDAVLCPGITGGAPAIADIDQSGSPATYTRFVNYLDWCAAVVPCGFDGEGLPLALQIACRGGAEATAIRISSAYQKATDWHRRHPSL